MSVRRPTSSRPLPHPFALQRTGPCGQGAARLPETDESAAVIRGRIPAANQRRRHYTFPLPVEIRFDDYTVDIPENQSSGGRRTADETGRDTVQHPAQLRHLAVRLDGVSLPAIAQSLPEWKPTRLNAAFVPRWDLPSSSCGAMLMT